MRASNLRVMLLAFAATCLMSESSKAGILVGDGGHVVKCHGISPTIELADIFEAKFRLRQQDGSQIFNWSETAAAASVEDHLSRFEADFVNIATTQPLLKRIIQIAKQTPLNWRNEAFGMLPLPAFPSIPAGCAIEVAAVASASPFHLGANVTFHLGTWLLLSNSQRATLLIHEAANFEAAEFSPEARRQLVLFIVGPRAFRAANNGLLEEIIASREAVDWDRFRAN